MFIVQDAFTTSVGRGRGPRIEELLSEPRYHRICIDVAEFLTRCWNRLNSANMEAQQGSPGGTQNHADVCAVMVDLQSRPQERNVQGWRLEAQPSSPITNHPLLRISFDSSKKSVSFAEWK